MGLAAIPALPPLATPPVLVPPVALPPVTAPPIDPPPSTSPAAIPALPPLATLSVFVPPAALPPVPPVALPELELLLPFFEGAITYGCPDDKAVDDAIQANIAAAGYGR